MPKVYAVLGLAGLYFFLIFFNIAGEFLVNIAGFIIPSYYSLNALFTASKVDDTQVCLAMSAFLEHELIFDSGSQYATIATKIQRTNSANSISSTG